MILLHTALALEARPLIARWGLKRKLGSRLGTYSENADRSIGLLVSGTGPLAAATAVGATLSRLESEGTPVRGLFSVGLCGSPDLEVARGSAFLVNRIHDLASGRNLYPDILYKHPWAEATVTTYGRLMTQDDAPSTLVEMEASGVFTAARALLPLHKIALLKVVSDHLEGTHLNPEQAEAWIAAQVEAVAVFLEAFGEDAPRLPEVPDALVAAAKAFGGAWSLSETQRHRLKDGVLSAFHRGRTDWTLLKARPVEPVAKVERNRCWRQVCDELAAAL